MIITDLAAVTEIGSAPMIATLLDVSEHGFRVLYYGNDIRPGQQLGNSYAGASWSQRSYGRASGMGVGLWGWVSSFGGVGRNRNTRVEITSALEECPVSGRSSPRFRQSLPPVATGAPASTSCALLHWHKSCKNKKRILLLLTCPPASCKWAFFVVDVARELQLANSGTAQRREK
jgi:hypothetical protein